MLIPRTMDAPCGARQVFTTVHDNQEQVGKQVLVTRGSSSSCRGGCAGLVWRRTQVVW